MGVTLHVTVIATSIYGTVHMDWKLQNNREKRSISRKKPFHRILIVANLENLAKNRQVGIICRINVKREQETGNRQTNRQTEYCNPSAHVRRALKSTQTRIAVMTAYK